MGLNLILYQYCNNLYILNLKYDEIKTNFVLVILYQQFKKIICFKIGNN